MNMLDTIFEAREEELVILDEQDKISNNLLAKRKYYKRVSL